MATSVTFYDFSKKVNSTAVPSGQGTAVDCYIKENTSAFNPTFVLNSNSWPSYNYAYWSPYYYFVADIVCTANNLFEITCSIDVMASWRTDILATNTFVNRSASSYNVMIKDPEVGNTQEEVRVAQEDSYYTDFDSVGCYLLRVAGADASSPAGVGTFVLNKAELADALNFMVSNDVWDAAWDGVVKSVFNPFQYVLSLKWIAVSYTTMTNLNSGTSKIRFGWSWESPHYYHVLSSTHYNFYVSLNKPTHYYSDFRKYDPSFSRYRLLLPGCGEFDIPSIDCDSFDGVVCNVDFLTCKATYYGNEVITDNQIFKFDGILGAEVQMSQVSHDIMQGISSGVGGAIAGLTIANPYAAGAGLALGAMGAMHAIIQGNPSSNGTNGAVGDLMANQAIRFTEINYGSTGFPINYGRMYNQNATLSSLSGFTKCPEASIDCNAPDELKNKINGFMQSGFYIE